MKVSYHNHTARCMHAVGTDEEYLLAAIRGGYEKYGYSDHTPLILTNGFVSPSRMTEEQLGEYAASVRSLAEKYKNDIEVHVGLEVEYYPEDFALLLAAAKKAGVEYFILGQHGIGEIEGNPGWINSFLPTEDKSLLTLYTDTVLAALDTGAFSYVAHPDVLNYRDDLDFYRQEARRLIGGAMAHGIPLEVNMFGLIDGRHYPYPVFWEEAAKLGAPVMLGRDAHAPARVDPTEEYEAAYRFIERHGLNLIEDCALKNIKEAK